MATRKIREMGDELLRKTSKPVKKVTERTKIMIDDMFETMYEAQGVGLAAPQIGILKRVVVIDVGDDNPLTLINPVITKTDGEQTGDEGCLSVPNKVAEVTRPNYVVCEALDEEMKPFTVEAEGLLARAICHECDHLDGILYPDVANGPLMDVTDVMEDAEEEIEE